MAMRLYPGALVSVREDVEMSDDLIGSIEGFMIVISREGDSGKSKRGEGLARWIPYFSS